MTPLTNTPSVLRWMFRCAEWALLLMMTLLNAIDQYYYRIQVTPNTFLKVVIFNLIFFALSFSFPVGRPLWQRRAYIATEIILIVIAQLLWIDLHILLYFFLIKSCFLLSRREVISTVVIAGVGYLTGFIYTLPLVIQSSLDAIHSQNLQEFYKPQALFLEALIEYIGISLFVILLGLVIVAEQRSRQHAETLVRKVETLATTLERSRIAREIHDSLGHTLTTLNVQLELSWEMLQRDPKRSTQALQNARQLASQCLEDVRRAVQTVRQQEFDLNEAIYRLIQQIKQNQSLIVETDLHLPPLPLQTSHQLYCIVQEGFTNIQKHAQATRVKLRSQVTSTSLILEIEDNGKGWDLTMPHPGYGLQGMSERVHLLGGKLQIQSNPGFGTHIQVTVPL